MFMSNQLPEGKRNLLYCIHIIYTPTSTYLVKKQVPERVYFGYGLKVRPLCWKRLLIFVYRLRRFKNS